MAIPVIVRHELVQGTIDDEDTRMEISKYGEWVLFDDYEQIATRLQDRIDECEKRVSNALEELRCV